MKKRFILGGAALLLAAGAQAQVYIGGAIGPSKIDIDCNASCDDGDTGYKIYGGLPLANKVLPGLALELGYIDFGKVSDSTGVLGVRAYHDIEVSAFTFAGALRANFTPALAGVGRLGVAYVDGKTTVGGAAGPFGARSSESSSEIDFYFGLGLEFALTKQLKLTGAADFTSYDTGRESGDARLLSVGLQYSF